MTQRAITFAIISSIALVGCSFFAPEAFAATSTVNKSIANVGENIRDTPILINYISYIMGFGIGMTGIGKLRQHMESSQVPLKDGLARVSLAGLFVSLPSVMEMLKNTGKLKGQEGEYQCIEALNSC